MTNEDNLIFQMAVNRVWTDNLRTGFIKLQFKELQLLFLIFF